MKSYREELILLALAVLAFLLFEPLMKSRSTLLVERSQVIMASVVFKEKSWWRLSVVWDERPSLLLTYEYDVGAEHFTSTLDMNYRDCYEAVSVGENMPVYVDNMNHSKSQPKCELDRLSGISN